MTIHRLLVFSYNSTKLLEMSCWTLVWKTSLPVNSLLMWRSSIYIGYSPNSSVWLSKPSTIWFRLMLIKVLPITYCIVNLSSLYYNILTFSALTTSYSLPSWNVFAALILNLPFKIKPESHFVKLFWIHLCV